MKKIKWFFKTFSAYLLEQKFIYFLLFLVLILTSASLLYLYSYNKGLFMKRAQFNSESRTYHLVIDQSVNREAIHGFLLEIEKTNRISELSEFNVIAAKEIGINNEIINTNVGYFYPNIDSRSFYLESEIDQFSDNTPYSAIVSPNFYRIVRDQIAGSGEIEALTLDGVSYNIVGQGTIVRPQYHPTFIYLSFEAMTNRQYDVKFINIIYNQRLDELAAAKLQGVSKKYFPASSFIIPRMYSKSELNSYYKKLLIAVLVSFFSILNVFGLFKYINLQRQPEFLIHRMGGAAIADILLLVFSEVILLITVSYLLGSFLFYLIKPVLINLNLYYPIQFNGYLLNWLILFISAVLAVLPIIFMIVKANLKFDQAGDFN